MRHLLLLSVVAALAACGGPSPSLPDSGLPPAEDAGQHSDAGAEPDGGNAPDAGSSPDGGTGTDAGVPTVDLVLTGIRLTDMGAPGKVLRAVAVHEASGDVVGTLEEVVTHDGQWFTFEDALVEGESYSAHLYIDFDEDGACDPSQPNGPDWGWSETGLLAVESRTEAYFHATHSTSNVCGLFP